jgi:hypothetical protein
VCESNEKKVVFMDEYSVFKSPQHHYKMTNEWIDYAENVHSRMPFKYPSSNNNSLLINNNSNSFLTNGNMHHQTSTQQFYSNKMKAYNSNLNNNNSSTLNQYNLMNKFLKPRGKCRDLLLF